MIQPLHSWITPSLAAALDLPRLRATPLHLWDWFFPGTSRLAAEVDDKREPKMKRVAALDILDDHDDDDDGDGDDEEEDDNDDNDDDDDHDSW